MSSKLLKNSDSNKLSKILRFDGAEGVPYDEKSVFDDYSFADNGPHEDSLNNL
jgi:hypothetical protein